MGMKTTSSKKTTSGNKASSSKKTTCTMKVAMLYALAPIILEWHL